MDHFGIGSGVAGSAEIYFRASRGTGRTTSLIESVKNGDRVVFLTEREGRRVKSLCKERGVEIEIIVTDPKRIESLFYRGSPDDETRLLFDHSWIEEYYRNAIELAKSDIDKFQRNLSGRGFAHIETQMKAREFARWER